MTIRIYILELRTSIKRYYVYNLVYETCIRHIQVIFTNNYHSVLAKVVDTFEINCYYNCVDAHCPYD